MSMHQGLDLSRFKKVSSDKKSVTLRHAKGHELKIAHSALTPAMKAHLDSLEDYKEEKAQKFAEGTPDKPVQPLDPSSPAPVQGQAPGQQPQATPPWQRQPNALADASQPVDNAQPQAQAPQPSPSPAAPPKPAVMPEAGQVNVVGQRPPPQQVAQQMNQEDAHYQQDLQLGHVKPETYQSLFAKKDTLGKIGTLFGLLVSGAGAGLTHTPNAVMEMMNKEIMNDFDAQKTTQTNASNIYNGMTQREQQKALAERYGVQNLADLSKLPYEQEQLKANAASLHADAALKSQTMYINKMKISALQQLQNDINKMPEGPKRQQQQGYLDNLSQATSQDVMQTNAQTADQIAARENLRPQIDQGTRMDNGLDQGRFDQILTQVNTNADMGIPGKFTARDVETAKGEAEALAKNRAVAAMFVDTFDYLDKKAVGGVLNPADRDAAVTALSARLASQFPGPNSRAEAMALADSLLPGAKDYGKSRDTKFLSAMSEFRANENGLQTIKRMGVVKPFPYGLKKKEQTASGGKSSDKPKISEGSTATNRQTGKKMIYKGGKWSDIEQPKQAIK